jgi:hypothetical protein
VGSERILVLLCRQNEILKQTSGSRLAHSKKKSGSKGGGIGASIPFMKHLN